MVLVALPGNYTMVNPTQTRIQILFQINMCYEITEHHVDPSGFSASVENLADVGQSLIAETAVFADTLLSLSERQDDLALANRYPY